MKEQIIAKVENIEYDIDINLMEQPDQRALRDFCNNGTSESMCITYSDSTECHRRQMTLRHWLTENGYALDYVMHKSKEKLYIVKEKKLCQQTTH